mmetsp:Transcript_39053/g.125556  ORF Transcript_39053/g.125556 Transcript_39053/m.125556 type:complete len:208 (+) Transcript_39053:527-1150(+)
MRGGPPCSYWCRRRRRPRRRHGGRRCHCLRRSLCLQQKKTTWPLRRTAGCWAARSPGAPCLPSLRRRRCRCGPWSRHPRGSSRRAPGVARTRRWRGPGRAAHASLRSSSAGTGAQTPRSPYSLLGRPIPKCPSPTSSSAKRAAAAAVAPSASDTPRPAALRRPPSSTTNPPAGGRTCRTPTAAAPTAPARSNSGRAELRSACGASSW